MRSRHQAPDRASLAMAGANVRSDGIVNARGLASYDSWGAQEFYSELDSGTERAEALCQAKIRLLRQPDPKLTHPYY